jgi:tetratricopeptide (TPR) repeat protein
MKKFLNTFSIGSLIVLFFITSCQMHGNNNGADDLLKNPPYASLTDSITQFPNNASLYLKRAELLTKNNQHEIAFHDLKRSWELDPAEQTAFEYVSNLSITGKSDAAVNFLQNCITKFPANEEFKRLLSDAYVQIDQPSKALELFDNMIKGDSTDAEAWYEKGRLLEQTHDTINAISSLKKAYVLQPTITYTLELANIYAEKNNADAIQLCDDAISRDSSRELTDPFFIKGIYYSNTKQYDAAIAQFDSCIHRDWKLTDAYIEKGIAFFKQKNYDNALNTFRMAASVTITSPDAYFWIGRCYEAINKKEDAIQYYQKALMLDKDFNEAREALKRVS